MRASCGWRSFKVLIKVVVTSPIRDLEYSGSSAGLAVDIPLDARDSLNQIGTAGLGTCHKRGLKRVRDTPGQVLASR